MKPEMTNMYLTCCVLLGFKYNSDFYVLYYSHQLVLCLEFLQIPKGTSKNLNCCLYRLKSRFIRRTFELNVSPGKHLWQARVSTVGAVCRIHRSEIFRFHQLSSNVVNLKEKTT